MKSILMELYLKYLHLNQKDVTFYLQQNDSKFKCILDEMCNLEDAIYSDLGKEKRHMYDEVLYRRVKLEDLKISYSFAEGFILAMQIAHEITNKKNKRIFPYHHYFL